MHKTTLRHRILREIPEYPGLDTFGKICALRAWSYRNIVVGATKDSLHPKYMSGETVLMSATEQLMMFERMEGGVWCNGACHFLAKVYADMGFTAGIYSYGLEGEGLLTHEVTLVLHEGNLHIQDPYFNCYYADEADNSIPLFRLFEMLGRLQMPRVIEGKPDLRTVVSISACRSWFATTAAEISQWQPFPGERIKFVGKFRTHYQSILNHDFTEKTMDVLKQQSLPKNLDYLLLFPIAYAENSRYYDAHRRHPFLDEINIRTALARIALIDGNRERTASLPSLSKSCFIQKIISNSPIQKSMTTTKLESVNVIEKTSKCDEFDAFDLCKLLPYNSSVAIYGTGSRGKECYHLLTQNRLDIYVAKFVDSFTRGTKLGLPVISPEKLRHDEDIDFVIICSMYSDQISGILEYFGIKNYIRFGKKPQSTPK